MFIFHKCVSVVYDKLRSWNWIRLLFPALCLEFRLFLPIARSILSTFNKVSTKYYLQLFPLHSRFCSLFSSIFTGITILSSLIEAPLSLSLKVADSGGFETRHCIVFNFSRYNSFMCTMYMTQSFRVLLQSSFF
jgi:hypothetical protein